MQYICIITMSLYEPYVYIVHPDLTIHIVRFLKPLSILNLNLTNTYHHRYLTDRGLVRRATWDLRNIRKHELRRAVVEADLDVVQHVFARSAKGKRTRRRFHTELEQAFVQACVKNKLDVAQWL